MRKVHVLTTRTSPNSAAFNLPLQLHKKLLREFDLDVTLFFDITDELHNCDVLLINSKFFRRWWSQRWDEVLGFLAQAKERMGRVLWFDMTDSTGTTQFQVLTYVDGYYKAQVLADKQLYLKRHYGGRLFTDYYHEQFGIEDSGAAYAYEAASAHDLSKIHVSWNSALGDYGHGIKYELYQWARNKIRTPFGYSAKFTPARKRRELDISCRVGRQHGRNTVRYQRDQWVEFLDANFAVSTDAVTKHVFWRELQNAKVVISPFGWGEITLRDFQVFINGAALFKPDMSHLMTWPPLYVNNQTYMAHRWDLTDLNEKLSDLISTSTCFEIAENAQALYRKYLLEHDGHLEFCQRLTRMVDTSP